MRIATVACAVALASCGLFVSDIDRTLGADAGNERDDAARDAGAGPHTDASDAAVDVTIDVRDATTSPDVRLADARPADAGSVDGTSHDANKQDGGLGDAQHDVVAPADAPLDVDHGPGYCARAVAAAPPAAAVFCEDFDEDASVAAQAVVLPPSMLATESTVWRSFPRAILVTANPLDGGTTGAALQKAVTLSPTASYAIQFDVNVTEFVQGASGSTVIATLTLGNADSTHSALGLAITAGSSGGISTIQVNEDNPADGGERHPVHAPVVVSLAAGWAHIELDVMKEGSWSDRLLVNGNLEETQGLGTTFADNLSPASVQVGLPYVNGKGLRTAYVDNILVETQ